MVKSPEDVRATTQVVRGMESTEQMLEVDDTPSSTSAQDPPNGGFRAWLHVVASFCIYFNSYGALVSMLLRPSDKHQAMRI
jgi:hypothetical protein